MLKLVVTALKQQFESAGNDQSHSHENALRLATAALLVEMGGADHYSEGDDAELILELLRNHFTLDVDEVATLFEYASLQANESVSLHEFTSVLHRSLTNEERERLLEMMWRIAYADEYLDPLEDALVRKVADLLYVRNTSLMKIRNRVLASQK
jgi:uncharacterized tellurite resistance protein B-like protein